MEVGNKTNKELADIWGVHYTTWLAWIKPFSDYIGRPVKGKYNTLQIDKMIEKLGPPKTKIPD